MDKLERLWLLSAELEGALLIMKKKGVTLTPSNNKFFVDKIAEMQNLLSVEEQAASAPVEDEIVQEEQMMEELAQQSPEVEESESVVEYLPVTEPEPVVIPCRIEPEVAEESVSEESFIEENEQEQETEEKEEIAESTFFEEKEDADIKDEPEHTEQPAQPVQPAQLEQPEQPEQPEQSVQFEQPEQPEVSDKPDTTPRLSEPVATPAPSTSEPIRLDEKLARHTSRDIYKAFTLNDKFRFRRALFGNNSSQYNEALDLISQMDTYNETADYFFTQYGWNPDDENVKAFMEIVKNHFES